VLPLHEHLIRVLGSSEQAELACTLCGNGNPAASVCFAACVAWRVPNVTVRTSTLFRACFFCLVALGELLAWLTGPE